MYLLLLFFLMDIWQVWTHMACVYCFCRRDTVKVQVFLLWSARAVSLSGWGTCGCSFICRSLFAFYCGVPQVRALCTSCILLVILMVLRIYIIVVILKARQIILVTVLIISVLTGAQRVNNVTPKYGSLNGGTRLTIEGQGIKKSAICS